MGHGTLVNGVQRLVTGGFDLVGGVQRKQAQGLTRVNGVAYEIPFAEKLVVTITGTGNSDNGYVAIGGTKYYSSATVEVNSGTRIIIHTHTVYLNGSRVQSASSPTDYAYTVVGNIGIALSVGGKNAVTARITEE